MRGGSIQRTRAYSQPGVALPWSKRRDHFPPHPKRYSETQPGLPSMAFATGAASSAITRQQQGEWSFRRRTRTGCLNPCCPVSHLPPPAGRSRRPRHRPGPRLTPAAGALSIETAIVALRGASREWWYRWGGLGVRASGGIGRGQGPFLEWAGRRRHPKHGSLCQRPPRRAIAVAGLRGAGPVTWGCRPRRGREARQPFLLGGCPQAPAQTAPPSPAASPFVSIRNRATPCGASPPSPPNSSAPVAGQPRKGEIQTTTKESELKTKEDAWAPS
eukprot:scaffold7549_cov111-Isochrysis_galbana.AAC.7